MYCSRAIEGATVSTGQVYNAGKRSVGKTTGTEYPKPMTTDNRCPMLVEEHGNFCHAGTSHIMNTASA